MKKEYKQDKWNLKDLLKTHKGKDFDEILNKLKNDINKFESYRTQLNKNITREKFFEILKLSENIAEQESTIVAYSYLWFSTDTKNQEARAFMDNMNNTIAELDNKMIFFTLWFKELDDKNSKRLIQDSGDYKYHLERIRAFKPYTLSEAEEKVIILKDTTGTNALRSIYTLFTSSFKFPLKIKNKTEILNSSQLTSYVRSKNPKLREEAYKSLWKVYSEHTDVLGDIYKNIVMDWKNESINIRGYKTPISVRNLGNDISDKSVEALLNVCKKNIGLFQEYFKLKAKILKIKKMSRYHLYAPAPIEKGSIDYTKATNIVLDSYNNFSKDMAEMAERVFKEKHIDSMISPAKKSGAYCYSITPRITPYVLVNFDKKDRDVMTLAHELGHAVHSMTAANHSSFTFHAPLVLAETASVFGEMIVTDRLLEEEKNKKKKQAILMAKLDDIYATVIRQTYFVLFEKEAHEMIAKGATVNELCEVYLKNLKEQFGNAVNVTDDFKHEWTYIPHIYETPFYCYAYSFGNLLVLALYNMYKKEGKNFVPKYLRLLSYGGSEKPSKILNELGIDIESEQFWQEGFEVIETMIKELKETC